MIELYNREILKNAIVSDINLKLINLYTVIKYYPDEVVYYIKIWILRMSKMITTKQGSFTILLKKI